MKTLLLTKSCNVYKIVGESISTEGLIYFCKDMQWSKERNDFVEGDQILQTHIKESWVEVVDSNSSVILRHLDLLVAQ